MINAELTHANECETCKQGCSAEVQVGGCHDWTPIQPKSEQVDTSGLSTKNLDTSEKPEQSITCETCDCSRTKTGCTGMPDLPLEKCWKPIKPVSNHPESTVMTDDELQPLTTGYVDYPKDSEGDYDWSHPKFTAGTVTPIMREVAKAQDAHTRLKLIEQGWKSPEEVKKLKTDFMNGLEQTLKDKGYVHSHSIARELKELAYEYDGQTVFDAHDFIKLIKRLEAR